MADIDGKSSTSMGATLPPSPLPLTRIPNITEHLQPQPVGSRVYQAIAEVNSGLEKATQYLHVLEQFNFFPAAILTAWLNSVQHLQADTNSHLLEVLADRELNNASYFDRLCFQRQRELRDSNDILIEAERLKQQLAAQEHPQEE